MENLLNEDGVLWGKPPASIHVNARAIEKCDLKPPRWVLEVMTPEGRPDEYIKPLGSIHSDWLRDLFSDQSWHRLYEDTGRVRRRYSDRRADSRPSVLNGDLTPPRYVH